MARLAVGIVIGIAACGAMIGAAMVTHAGADLARFLWWDGALFAIAGGVAGERRRALGVAIGGAAPIAGLALAGIAFTSVAWAGSVIAVALVATAIGALARRLDRARAAGAIAVLALALFAAGRWVVPRLVRGDALERVNQTVPALSLVGLDGAPLDPVAWRDRVVILAFWATWCEPCRAELPELRAIHARYRDDPHVAFLAINTGTDGDTLDGARAFVQRHGWDVPSGHSPDGTAAAALGIRGLPAIAILDRAGRLRVVHRGYDRSESLATAIGAEVDRLLGP